ncbi:MAG TPA: tRNA pseudouridine(38-40) synthase TruA, partial [Actinomycetota bacterium]|nr:tRNA pseudouridine(38-40) synthase TruA [Actinomycetota bacterium]
DLAYDGAPFRGFARQPGQKTVQGDLEDAQTRVLGATPALTVAGRTDAGVHAVGQVVSAAGGPDDTDPAKVRDALNGLCGPSIAVHACRRAPDDFNARFDARSRTYVYALFTGPVADPWLSRTSWHRPGPLDLDAMAEAAGHLVGRHDYSSFGRLPAPDATAERTLYELSCSGRGSIVRIRARADAFIRQMVRSLAGTLVAVGEGKLAPGDMPSVLAARDRSAAGPVAPPHGLCLVSVEYDDGWSRPFDPFE